MNSNNAQTSSGPSTTSTLRPRAKRLISGLDEGDETTFDSANAPSKRIPSPAPAPFDSRSASPIPPAHPQRATGSKLNDVIGRGGSRERIGWSRDRQPSGSPSPFAGIWGNSLTALQGLASDLLGTDISTPDDADTPRFRRPLSRLNSAVGSTRSPAQWGPPLSSLNPKSGGIGAGTKEEQMAAFRAQKRKDMLMGQDSSYADTLGKFKRRLSDDRSSASAPPGDVDDRDALVYLHPVHKDDTLAGITIRYNIPPNLLRKANRMWPNDKVQVRQNLMLPVDACGVKGRPVSSSGVEEDLLGSESEALDSLKAEEVGTPTMNTPLANGSDPRSRANSASTHATSSQAMSASDTDAPWQHDSWVMLPGNTKATEIVRLSRREIGYFPPARRKSISWSDLDTPTSSLDLARTAGNDVANPVQSSASPQRKTPPRPAHVRRSSNASSGYFPSFLSGPGGVGSMSKNVHFPGPAQDGLNKMFAKHLPDVAPPRNQNTLYQPEMPLYTDEPTPVGSGAGTPAYPHAGSGNVHLENFGGAIESWVRRMATKAKTAPPERRHVPRASMGAPGKGAGGIGDLIEMTNEFEIGDDDDNNVHDQDESGRDRGRQESIPTVLVDRPRSSSTKYLDGGVRERARNVGSSGSKSGKAD